MFKTIASTPPTMIRSGVIVVIMVLAVAVGWGAWFGLPMLLQVAVLGTVAMIVGLNVLEPLPSRSALQIALFFVAGAGVGALANLGEVSLLLGAMLGGFFWWANRQTEAGSSEASAEQDRA